MYKAIDKEKRALTNRFNSFLKEQKEFDILDIKNKALYEDILNNPGLDSRIKNRLLDNLELSEIIRKQRSNLIDELESEYRNNLKELENESDSIVQGGHKDGGQNNNSFNYKANDVADEKSVHFASE